MRIALQQNSDACWDDVLPAGNVIQEFAPATNLFAGKTVLVTGAGGSIGSALATKILSENPRQVLLLDHSEQALHQLERFLASQEDAPPYRLLPGDLGDCFLMAAIFQQYRPDLILHAGAYKHVPLLEANPFAAVQNNTILTWQLARAASEHGLPQFLLISTDKAANPRSILGASKRVAEQAVLRWSAPSRRYAAVRLVNVLGSNGSVGPLFLEQIRRGGPLTITHPDAARYFLTLEDTVRLILIAATFPKGSVVYIPRLSEPVRITELAGSLAIKVAGAVANKIPMEFSGLRPGDKLVEELVSAGESLRPTLHPAVAAIAAPRISANRLDQAILQLTESIQHRNIALLLETLRQLVPDYQPSETLCPSVKTPPY